MSVVRGVFIWLLAWLASAALWMVLADSVRLIELFVGAGVAALAATAFELVRRQRVTEQAMKPELSVRALLVLVRAFPDVGRLTRAAFAQLLHREAVRGKVVALPFGHTADDPDDRAIRAVAVGFGSIAPNTIMIDVDPETGLLLAHQLEVTGKPSDVDPMKLR